MCLVQNVSKKSGKVVIDRSKETIIQQQTITTNRTVTFFNLSE